MSHWLNPVRRALDERATPVTFFFRNDDAGWADEALRALANLFVRATLPLDLAVIPAALERPLAHELRRRVAEGHGLGVHQHGWSHRSHEASGRKCEFGPSRSLGRQFDDIRRGRERLADLLGECVAPIFTPPWNRCTDDTAACLVSLGFAALSRDVTAGAIHVDGLAALNVTVDWFAKARGRRQTLAELGAHLADAIRRSEGPLGVMFHHAVMMDEDMRATSELLAVLSGHEAVSARSMAACVSAGSARVGAPNPSNLEFASVRPSAGVATRHE